MSMVCSISRTQDSPVHAGRTSIAMLCHEASNSLWPSSRVEIPALPLHGRSLRKGVKFSVHTTSRGRTPCSKCIFASVAFGWSPSGRKDMTGRIVLVESIKLSEAQKRPDNALVRVSHLWSALDSCQPCPRTSRSASRLLTPRSSRLPARPKARHLCPLLWCRPMVLLPMSLHPSVQD